MTTRYEELLAARRPNAREMRHSCAVHPSDSRGDERGREVGGVDGYLEGAGAAVRDRDPARKAE